MGIVKSIPLEVAARIKQLGQQVRLARTRRGWSIAELAVKASINRNTLSALERLGCLLTSEVVAEHGVENRRLVEVGGDPSIGNRDEAEPRVLDPPLQRLRHNDLDAVRELARASCVNH